jgi:hypothetical protein
MVLANIGGEFQVANNFGIFLGYDGQYVLVFLTESAA